MKKYLLTTLLISFLLGCEKKEDITTNCEIQIDLINDVVKDNNIHYASIIHLNTIEGDKIKKSFQIKNSYIIIENDYYNLCLIERFEIQENNNEAILAIYFY